MGVGKSTIAREVCAKTGLYGLDTDDLIVSLENRDIKTIFKEDGEDYFRRCESITAKWLKESVKNTIISTGGGFFMAEGFKKIGRIVYLKSTFDYIFLRLKGVENELEKRPLFQDETKAKILFESRTPLYEEMADLTLNVENRSIDEITNTIIESFKL